jgi:hypothetical protein
MSHLTPSTYKGRANLLRMQQEIPLTEPEVAAVEDGVAAYTALLDRLADVPTPAGPTPRALARVVAAPGAPARPRLPGAPASSPVAIEDPVRVSWP